MHNVKYKKKMEKSVQKTLIVTAGIVVVLLIGILAYSNLSSGNTVTGNGQATIKVVPDLVSVYFNVDTKADTSAEATSKNAEIVDNLIAELVAQGFERDEIQTMNFNVYPLYDWVNGQQISKGFQATHSLKVELSTSDSGKIGQVIDAGVNAGAGISYINFELSQEKENNYKSQALKSATEDAKIKAQSIASGLGKNLGRLVSVSDNSFNYYPWPVYSSAEGTTMDASAAKAATTNISPGEQEISASVTAVFKIK
jgi:uncharacterized protein YggE